jgi:cytochrome c oxidase cbb3-type subunit 3
MRNSIPSYIRVPVIFFIIFGLVEYFIDSGEQPAFITYPAVVLFLLLVLLLLIGIEAIIGALENVMLQSLDEEAKARFLQEKKSSNWLMNMYKKLAGGKPIEQEGEIILDHNYDGIKELDNSLPPWWLYSFYASIIFAAVYLVRYHIFEGPDQATEFEREMVAANLAIEEYKKTAKDLVDINTVTLLTDASDLSAGKSIFETNCVACHMADGGGGIGPNLTDEYWILGGGIKNVFRTLVEGGRDGKGMISWKATLKPLEMAQVGSYLLTFQGTTPANPKAPEGDIWIDPDKQEQSTDKSTQPETNETVTDSTSVAMN